MASLLEVGTGFHPELTGRENVFLNGAILGMTRQETKRTFDEIVAFSGVEKSRTYAPPVRQPEPIGICNMGASGWTGRGRVLHRPRVGGLTIDS